MAILSRKVIIDFNYVEEGSGLEGIGFNFLDSNGEDHGIWFVGEEIEQIEETDTGYRITTEIYWDVGEYILEEVNISDKVGNSNCYNDPVLKQHSFKIDENDFKIPGIDTINIVGSPVKDGGNIQVQFTTEEVFEEMELIYYNDETETNIYIRIDKQDIGENGEVDYHHDIKPYIPSGSYELDGINIIWGQEGNFEYYEGSPYNSIIEVDNPREDKIAPELDVGSIKVNKTGRKLIIDFNYVEEGSGLDNIVFLFEKDDDAWVYKDLGSLENIEKTKIGYRMLVCFMQ